MLRIEDLPAPLLPINSTLRCFWRLVVEFILPKRMSEGRSRRLGYGPWRTDRSRITAGIRMIGDDVLHVNNSGVKTRATTRERTQHSQSKLTLARIARMVLDEPVDVTVARERRFEVGNRSSKLGSRITRALITLGCILLVHGAWDGSRPLSLSMDWACALGCGVFPWYL
jgi:hypothetical protein